MSYADDILNGSFGNNKKKKKKEGSSYSERILNGTFGEASQPKEQIQLTGSKLLDNVFTKYSQQNSNVELIAPEPKQKTIWDRILKAATPDMNTVKDVTNVAKEAINLPGKAWNAYIDYAGSGNLEKDAKNVINTVKREKIVAQSLINQFKRGNLEQKKETLLTGKEGQTIADRYILPVAEGANIAGKTVVGTAVDMAKGGYNYLAAADEEILKATGVIDEDEYNERKLARQAFMKEDTTGKIWEDVFGWDKKTRDYVNKNSFVTEENGWGRVIQGMTYSLEMAAAGGAWKPITFLSASGSSQQQEYRKGASDLEALTVGTLSGGIEVFAETMFGGELKLPGTGKWASVEALENALTEKISNGVTRYAVQHGFNIANEQMEEVVGGIANSIVQMLVYKDKKELQDLYSNEQLMEDLFYTAITTALSGGTRIATQGGMNQVREDIKSGRSQITGYTQNEQKIIDAEVENRMQEAKEKGEKVKRADIVEQVQEDLQNGDISLEGLQRGVGGQEYQNYKANEDSIKDIRKQLKYINEDLNTNYKTKVNKMNPEYQNLLNQKQQLEEQLKPLVANRQDLGNKAYTETIDALQNDAMAQRSIYEYEQKGQNYQYEKTTNMNENSVGLRDSASKFGNNTTQFHKFVDAANKVQQMSKNGVNIRFTNTQDIKEKGLAGQITHTVQEGDTIESIAKEYGMTVDEFKELNGNVKLTPGENIKVYGFTEGLFDRDNNTLYLNIDSNRALEEILGHELTHTLENTDDYTSLRKLLYKQAKKNGIFDKEKARIESIYDENTDIDSELTAELASKLFTDEKFIEQLGTKPSFRKTVMNFIDDMITAFKGTKEEKQLVALKRQYQKAFSNMNTEVEGEGTQFAKDKYGTALMNRYYNALTKYQWNSFLTDLDNGDIILNEEVETPTRIDDKVIYAQIKNGKPQVTDVYELNHFTLSKLNVTQEEMYDIIDSELKKEGYDEREIKRISEVFSSTSLFSRYNTKSHSFTNTSGQYRGSNGQINRVSQTDQNRTGIVEGDAQTNKLNIEEQIAPFNNVQRSITKDNQGRNLTQEQQEHFKNVSPELIDRDGNLMTFYHGTPNTNFNIFESSKANSGAGLIGLTNKGFYFTDNINQAEAYAIPRGTRAEVGETPGVKEVYLNMTNPLVVDTTTKEGLQTIKDTFGIKGNKKITFNNIDNYVNKMLYNDAYNLKSDEQRQEFFNNTGYDGVILKHENGNEYIVFNSNQIKNVDNLNPTSNPDIRYSISKQGKLQENGQDVTLETSNTGTTGSLMAIHNLSENKLNGILDLGGFPVPSIAITNPSVVSHDQYGEITALFGKETIDPEYAVNEVYDRDVWSPTFPTVDYNIDSKQLEKVSNKLGIRSYDLEDFADNNKTPEYLSDRLTRVDEVVDKYVADNNIEYETTYKSPELRVEFNELSNDIQQFVIDNDLDVFKLVNDENLRNEYYRLIKEYYENANFPEQAKQSLYEEKIEQLNNYIDMQKGAGDNFVVRGFSRYQDDFNSIKNGLAPEVDEYATQKNKREAAINNGLKEYLINEVQPLFTEKGIYNGKDYLTPSGNRRSFWQLHDEYNLENIVNAMTKGDTKGTQNWIAGFGQIQAQMATEFNSLDEIRAAQDRLMPDANNTRLVELREALEADLDSLADKQDGWNGMEIASELVADFASKKNHDIETFRKLLKNDYQSFAGVTDAEITKIISDLEQLKDLPTDYFEAKPQRAVGLDEIEQLVIPNTTTQETKQRLQDMGIEYTEYDPTIEGDRNRVINQFDELKWSMNKENIAPMRQRGLTYNANIREDIAPTYEDIIESIRMPNRTLNPLEISQLTPEDANTTPELPTRRYRTGSGQSSFFENATETTKMLPEEARDLMKTEENIKYYNEVTNEDSMNRALTRLNEGGAAETLRWFKADSKQADATDVAEGWILMKQYSDNGDYSSMVEVAKKMRDIGTQAGQTVQAFNIMARLTPEGMVKYAQNELSEAYDQMVKNKTQKWIDENKSKFDLTPDEVEFIKTTMEKVKDMEDGYEKKVELAKIQKIMTDKLPPQKGQGIKGWMRISMLFNPKTQVRNVVGNALIMPVNSFGDLFASMADYAVARKTGVRTTGLTKVSALAKGGIEGFKQATNDFKLGINTKNMEGNRFEIGEGKSFRERTIIGKGLNRTESMLNYVMDAGDRVFSQAAYENSIANQLKLNNTNTVTPEMIDIALEESLSRTWNDNNNYTRFVLNVRKGLNAINVRGYGLGDVLIPFAKTPANLTKAIVDYSPVGLVNTIVQGYNLRNNLQTETWTAQQQHQFVQTLGKATAGSMLYVLAYALAKAGIATGASDDDKDAKDFLKNTLGISGYSIKIGDKSFTYDWAQPIAAPLAIMTNIENGKDAQGLLEAIISSTDSASSVLMEQSFLQSLNDVLNSEGSFTENLMNKILDLPTRAVPTFVKQINDMVDGTQRQTFVYGKPLETAINKFKAKIPGLSQDLAPTVDTMGREVKKYGGKNNFFNVFLNPANVNTENISEEAGEIYRVYQQTGDKTILPRVAPYYINSKGEKTILTPQERAKFQTQAGEIIEEGIKDFMNSSEYVVMSEEDKAKTIKHLIDYAYNKARKDVVGLEMSNTYNRVNKYLDNGGTVGSYYLNKEVIDDTYKWLDKNEDAKVALATVTTGDVFSYRKIYNDISTIKANTKQDKQEVLTYVQDLDLDVIQKAIIFKQYYSSFNDYNREIIQYVAESDLSQEQKYALLESMNFKVNKNTGAVSWKKGR